jgi:drug/metabolite transporter (DMT)-like permease
LISKADSRKASDHRNRAGGRKSHFYGILLMFLAACSFGAGAVLIKLAYRTGLRPAELLPLQNLVALACLWPMMLITHGFPRLKRRQMLGGSIILLSMALMQPSRESAGRDSTVDAS